MSIASVQTARIKCSSYEPMRDFLAEARVLHSRCIVLDGHADTPQRFVDEGWEWSGMPLGTGHLSAQSAVAGGLHG